MKQREQQRLIRLPYPHQGQQTVIQNAKRFNWLAAGRRWRKTTLAMSIAVEAAARGGSYIWGAPTFDQVRIGFAETKRALANVAEFNLSRMTATLPNGEIVFRSLDNPDNVRGHTADGVIIDEAPFVKPAAWREVLRPMLIDTEGWAWLIGTPSGHNWFWQEWIAAPEQDDSIAWQIPTVGVRVEAGQLIHDPHPLENPDVPFSEIARLWAQMPERTFQQEILAQFMESGGGVFRRIMEAATAIEQDEAIGGHEYIIGVDWGQSRDFTVLAVVDISESALVYLDRFNQIDYTVQRGRLLALAERFRPVSIIAELNAMGTPIVEQLQRDGLPMMGFMTTNATKAAAIDGLALAFERGDLAILSDPVLLGELQAYEMSKSKTGLRTFSAPSGIHDDTVMALAIGWSGVGGRGATWKNLQGLGSVDGYERWYTEDA